MTDKMTTLVVIGAMTLVTLATIINSNISNIQPASACQSGKVIVYEDASVACVTPIKGGNNDR